MSNYLIPFISCFVQRVEYFIPQTRDQCPKEDAMNSQENGSDNAWWRPDGAGPALLDTTLGHLLDEQAAVFASRTAVVVDETIRNKQTSWTYSELKVDADVLARAIMSLGFVAGDRVAVMAQNCAEWVLLEYALAKAGVVLVTVNPALKKAELKYLFTQGRIGGLVFVPGFRGHDIAQDLRDLMPDLDNVSGGARSDGGVMPWLRWLIGIGSDAPAFSLPFDQLLNRAQMVSPDELATRQNSIDSGDIAQIQYTSGTTGKPKGAMLKHASTVNNARLSADRGGITQHDVLLSAMPFFHTAGCVCNVMSCLASGAKLVTMDEFDPERMLTLWRNHSPTILNAVPTMVTRMFEHPFSQVINLKTLRKFYTGGTSIPPSLIRNVKDVTGGDPMIIMGMTECSPIITQTDDRDSFETRITTAGTPLPHTEIKITDPETGEIKLWGESGELCIRGYLTTAGYFEMPDKTAETLSDDGWLRSGDLAQLERTGHLRIVGRLKDMIIRGGENVYPVEIEDCLLDHDTVSQAQVVGVPDADLGEEICAFVVPSPGAQIDPSQLQTFCRERMARHKMPKFIVAIAEMPMTTNGKVQKFSLRDQAVAAMTQGTLKSVRK
jgi:fatty-acyl-CoA synthase